MIKGKQNSTLLGEIVNPVFIGFFCKYMDICPHFEVIFLRERLMHFTRNWTSKVFVIYVLQIVVGENTGTMRKDLKKQMLHTVRRDKEVG